jgi:hypothetical protein
LKVFGLLHLLQPMHAIDVLLDSFTRLFRHQRYSPSGNKEHIEKIATAVAIAHNLVRI